MTMTAYTPTASQWAAAAMHLERRDEWRYFWSAGVRYVSIISGRSNRLWIARADADGCACPWSQKTFAPCSHRIALELDAMEADLIEARDRLDADVDVAFMSLALSKRGSRAGAGVTRVRYEDLFGSDD
jgi:hypothetical protein